MLAKAKGFGLFLLVAIVLLAAILWFLPAPAIKWGIETYGSEHVGAKVEVGDVSFSWLSLTLAIKELQVTNPDMPMENWLVVDHMETSVDMGPLFNGKLTINELAVEGVVLGAARTSSGALGPRPAPAAAEEEGISLASLGLPNPDELVAGEKAIYENKINAYKAELTLKQQAIEKALAELPNEDSFNAYKKRIAKAKKKAKGPLGNLLALKDYERIHKDIKKEVKKVKSVQRLVKRALADLNKDLAVLKKMPSQSAAEIVGTLGLENSVVANAGKTLLAGRFEQWVQQAQGIYDVAVGGEETEVVTDDAAETEPEIKTTPDFVIRRITLSGRLSQGGQEGEMSGVISNVNDAPSLSSEPMTIDLKAAGVSLGRLVLFGTVDHRNKGQEKDVFDFSLTDSSLENYPLTNQPDMTLLLKKSLFSVTAKATIEALSRLDLSVDAAFSQLDLEVNQGADEQQDKISETQQALISALKGASEINLKGRATGDINKPTISLTSNLDKILGQAISHLTQSKIKALKAEVAQKLQQELSTQLAPLQESLNNIGGLGELADDKKNEIDALLKNIK